MVNLLSLRVESLKVYIQKIGLTDCLVSQLDHILAEQFRESTIREVAGSAFSREGKLELEIIKNSVMNNIEEAMFLFQRGDYSRIQELYQFASQAATAFRGYG